MAVDDLWTKRGPDGKKVPSQRHGRGKRWRCRYTDDAGQPKQKLFERRADADRWDANIRADVSRGVYVDPREGKTTVETYAEAWRANRLHRDSTEQRVERSLRLHVYPVIGGLHMSQVRASHIQSWVKNRSRELEPSTLRVVYSILVAMFNVAAIDRVIGISPCQGIQLPDVDSGDLFIPTAEQVHAVTDALAGEARRPGRYQALPTLAAGTGLRQGEAWGLELKHVDFLRRTISVVQQLKTVDGRKPYLCPPKTSLSARTVEMGQVVAEALARHLEAFPVVEVEIDDETDPRKPVRRMAKLLFLNGIGSPINRAHWSRVWIPAVKEGGLPQGFGFHGLRHFYATLLIHNGASVKTVQTALGHATPTITLNTYVGHWPDAIDTTRGLVDSVLGRKAPRLRAVGS